MQILFTMLTALVSFVYLFLMAKLMGHRQISQMGVFDYINGITIGSIAAELATDLESPWKPAIAMAVYGVLTLALCLISSKAPRMRKYIDGAPSIILHNGKLYRENMRKAKLDLTEFLSMCRQQGYFDLSQIYSAVFEYNGRLSILPTEQQRPLTPQDMNLQPPQTTFFTEVIMDGRVLDANLHRMGKEEKWLKKQLKDQGFQSPREVFLGLCDQEGTLTLYRMERA